MTIWWPAAVAPQTVNSQPCAKYVLHNVQYGAHKMKFKSYIGLDVNKVCGINKYQKPRGFAAAERADRLRPGLSAKIVNAAGDLHLLVLCETRKQGLRRLQPFHVERDIFHERKIYL